MSHHVTMSPEPTQLDFLAPKVETVDLGYADFLVTASDPRCHILQAEIIPHGYRVTVERIGADQRQHPQPDAPQASQGATAGIGDHAISSHGSFPNRPPARVSERRLSGSHRAKPNAVSRP